MTVLGLPAGIYGLRYHRDGNRARRPGVAIEVWSATDGGMLPAPGIITVYQKKSPAR